MLYFKDLNIFKYKIWIVQMRYYSDYSSPVCTCYSLVTPHRQFLFLSFQLMALLNSNSTTIYTEAKLPLGKSCHKNNIYTMIYAEILDIGVQHQYCDKYGSTLIESPWPPLLRIYDYFVHPNYDKTFWKFIWHSSVEG